MYIWAQKLKNDIRALIWKALVLIIIRSIFEDWFWNSFQIQFLIIEFQWFFQSKIQLCIKNQDTDEMYPWTQITIRETLVHNQPFLIALQSPSQFNFLAKVFNFLHYFFVKITFDFAQKYNLWSFPQKSIWPKLISKTHFYHINKLEQFIPSKSN